jgi:tryptophanyl-tRNA synthetase
MANKKRLLSGMRPTGPIHLGHMLGALTNWKLLQRQYECYYMIADWHALMSEYEDPSKMQSSAIDMAADWLAFGIDPDISTIFVQSHVKEHLELFMIFSNIVPLPWLERCPTYKEQLREIKGRDLTAYGFLGYPVLQAADILVYMASVVPIGMDQMPHLELTREIARRFNSIYNETFPEPEALLAQVPKLLGTDNRKMSKSYNNFISLGDSDDIIAKKIGSMITDPKRVKLSDKGHPDICNVFSYYGFFAENIQQEARDWCKNAKLGCTACKRKLSEIVIEFIKPYRQKRESILQDKGCIEKILTQGDEKASDAASKVMKQVYRAMRIK